MGEPKSHSRHKDSSSKKHRRDVHDDDEKHTHKKHKHRDRDAEDSSSSRHHHHKSSSSKKKRKETNGAEGLTIMDDDDDEGVWVEKDITEDGERPLATGIPTSQSLGLTSHASIGPDTQPLPPSRPVETSLKRDEWMMMDPAPYTTIPALESGAPRRALATDDGESLTEDYGEPSGDKRILGGGVDYFSSLGTERRKKNPKPDAPDPEKLVIHEKELNTQLIAGKSLDEYVTPTKSQAPQAGGPGSTWRMSKLKRTYELAEEEGRDVEEVARERYDTQEDWQAALDERRILDERKGKRASMASTTSPKPSGGNRAEQRWIFNDDSSRPSSRASFRRPGEASGTAPSTPNPAYGPASSNPGTPGAPPPNRRVDSLRLGRSDSSSRSSPIPSVLPPAGYSPSPRTGNASTNVRPVEPVLSSSELNKLQARVLKAKLMGSPDAVELEAKFERERAKAAAAPPGAASSSFVKEDGTRVEMLPTLDGRGRLYDVGEGKAGDQEVLPGNRRAKPTKVETRDPKTGDVVRLNEDDDSITLGEMLRAERLGGGMADQKNMDAELARQIMGDGKFENDLDYMDDNADKLGRKKMRSDAMKRQFAINDYARTQKALSTCPFCYGEDDSLPKAGIIAMGTRAYLSCTLNEELVDGHCYIVPIQHCLSMLEADDDAWDEVKNFMKCLIRMGADQKKGYIFYETVMSLKWQKHTYIECIPVPLDQFDDLPAYFKESILASEAEWSQHKKLIDFSSRPGGFRRAMVPHLPYFMVQWDHKGEKGYGHVIEGMGDSAAAIDPEGDDGGAVDEGDRGGGEFPKYFAAEIIGNVLELEPRKWRRPRRIEFRTNKERVKAFNKTYGKYDWTGLIGKS